MILLGYSDNIKICIENIENEMILENIIAIKKKDGQLVKAKIIELDENYIDKIMDLQKKILNSLEDKRLYAASDRKEFIEYLKSNGRIIGCITGDGSLIAMGVYVRKGFDKGNYGYDIGLNGEELLKVGQIESTIVIEEFRGNKLQKIICEILEGIGKVELTPIMCATASPYNKFSVNTFINLGYRIKKDIIKYGGLRRYVLVKNINL